MDEKPKYFEEFEKKLMKKLDKSNNNFTRFKKDSKDKINFTNEVNFNTTYFILFISLFIALFVQPNISKWVILILITGVVMILIQRMNIELKRKDESKVWTTDMFVKFMLTAVIVALFTKYLWDNFL